MGVASTVNRESAAIWLDPGCHELALASLRLLNVAVIRSSKPMLLLRRSLRYVLELQARQAASCHATGKSCSIQRPASSFMVGYQLFKQLAQGRRKLARVTCPSRCMMVSRRDKAWPQKNQSEAARQPSARRGSLTPCDRRTSPACLHASPLLCQYSTYIIHSNT